MMRSYIITGDMNVSIPHRRAKNEYNLSIIRAVYVKFQSLIGELKT